jgi:hypothetical protein
MDQGGAAFVATSASMRRPRPHVLGHRAVPRLSAAAPLGRARGERYRHEFADAATRRDGAQQCDGDIDGDLHFWEV